MAIIKCKMCGGDLNLVEGSSVAECEFCGSVQTVPKVDDEKKLTLFTRANRLRSACEFDKAAGIYEAIVADFQEEAEAYWGLVLCKFGIEYVDDPTTGKKIPTCHRSSFNSIMDDADFEQALENADVVARRVYREEAKQIEEIRKGIIAVSANEEPYDIFICYKETSETGDRTLDSVLAQDVYDSLTDKGYRVFFSRITLEDKLGVEYEPYIFAALNSARVMLAFGTDYEYFNAVWVKNEWSRFLKLMAKDKDKHLIPCFKGIDVYDMPKEFARLQAQDMGKVGAIQDLLRGIEKLLPRQTETQVITQERVVVGGSGDNKIASLLDRGNMALEDADWAKADSFFEDVLNNDSKNAQAYLGKNLAAERCRTIDAFVRKRKDATQNVQGETLSIAPNHEHIQQMAEKYSLTDYLSQETVRKLYNYDLQYHSDVSHRKQQYRNEENYWANHKLLSRAEKFAVGVVAENLQREKKALFAALSDRIKQAESAESLAKSELRSRYENHISKADKLAEDLYNDALKRRDMHYQQLRQIADTSTDIKRLTGAAQEFDKLDGYQESKKMAEHCRQRAAEEQSKLDAAAEAKRIADAQAAAIRKKKNTITGIIVAASVAVVIALIVIMKTVIIPNSRYNAAEEMLANGQFLKAEKTYQALDDYKDAPQAAIYARANYVYMCAHNRDPQMEAVWYALQPDDTQKETVPEADAPAELGDIGFFLEFTEQFNPDTLQAIFDYLNENENEAVLLQTQTTQAVLVQKLTASYELPEDVVQQILELYLSSDGDIEQVLYPEPEPEQFTVDLSFTEEDTMCMDVYDYARELFISLGDYRNSAELAETMQSEKDAVKQSHYDAIREQGKAYMADEEFEKALVVFDALAEYLDTSEDVAQTLLAQQESIERARAASYASAEEMILQEDYAAAYATFKELDTYSDSADRALACAALAGKNAEDESKWLDALKWYEICNDADGIVRVKYGFVQANYINTNEITYAFLKELVQLEYKDAKKQYDKLYEQKFTVRVNTDYKDTESHSTSVDVKSDYDDIYVHVLYTGGTPEQKVVRVSAVVEYYTEGNWRKWSTSYIDSLTTGQWRYESFCTVGRRTFRFVLKNLDTGEQITVVPINPY